jgi:beta-galactosidase
LDLPAYTLRNYQIVWEVLDTKGAVAESGFTTLPAIRPGDKPLTQAINWTMPASNAGQLKISLLSPVNYNVYDTIIYLQKPVPPVVKKVIPGENGVRIVFEKNATAREYTVKYGKEKFTAQSDTTLNDYIDVKKLDKGQLYQFQVIGLNALGEGTPSQTVSSTPTTDLLPPVIWHSEPADSSFFIGYGYENYDYLYEIRYGTQAQDTTQWRTLKVTTKGVCQIPNLENGKTYQFQMRRIVQQYITSSWSEVHQVTPDGNRLPEAPKITRIARKGSQAVISFKPVDKAIGYLVRYEESGKEKIYQVSGSTLEYIRLQGLLPDQVYTFRLFAINANGQSQASQGVTTSAVAVK